jgi:hypothetical protein
LKTAAYGVNQSREFGLSKDIGLQKPVTPSGYFRDLPAFKGMSRRVLMVVQSLNKYLGESHVLMNSPTPLIFQQLMLP